MPSLVSARLCFRQIPGDGGKVRDVEGTLSWTSGDLPPPDGGHVSLWFAVPPLKESQGVSVSGRPAHAALGAVSANPTHEAEGKGGRRDASLARPPPVRVSEGPAAPRRCRQRCEELRLRGARRRGAHSPVGELTEAGGIPQVSWQQARGGGSLSPLASVLGEPD